MTINSIRMLSKTLADIHLTHPSIISIDLRHFLPGTVIDFKDQEDVTVSLILRRFQDIVTASTQFLI